jgi:hypothetical protein
MDGKIKECVCIKFCMELGKTIAKTLEMLCEAFGEHSLCLTAVFEWQSLFMAGQVSVEDDECSVRPSTSRMTGNVEKFGNSSTKSVVEQSVNSDTIGISYGVCQENRKCEHVPYCSFITTDPPMHP